MKTNVINKIKSWVCRPLQRLVRHNRVGSPTVSLDTEKKLIIGVFPDGQTHTLNYKVEIKEPDAI